MDFFDLHCDTPFECYKKNQEFYVNRLAVSAKHSACFENWSQVFAVWIKDDTENPFFLYKNILSDFKNKLSGIPHNLTPYFAVEGGVVLEKDAERLFILKQDGIKLLTLTWNGENAIAGGVNSDKGLTSFGETVINTMNRLKIGCDLSHTNEKSFYSAIEKAEYPLATHSNCYALCDHKRNLKDEQIKLIAQKGGIIGLCFYPEFLKGNTIDSLYKNIFHLCDMGLENHIAIGSDFDGAKMDKCLDKTSKVPDFYAFLKQKGFSETLLYKIFYKNAYKFIANLD